MQASKANRQIPRITLLLLLISALCAHAAGRVEEITVDVPSLADNLLGDPPTRTFSVALPPGYDDDDRSYPVAYALIGFGGLHANIAQALSGGIFNQIETGAIAPMIFVFVDGINRVGGSNYANSAVAGHWEDMIARDLVAAVDGKYRTLRQAASRGISGHSMGAQGAMAIALKNPDVFSAVYSAKGFMDYPIEEDSFFSQSEWSALLDALESEADMETALSTSPIVYPLAVAFSPNPDRPPLFIDMPYAANGDGLERQEPAWSAMVSKFPVGVLDQHEDAAAQLLIGMEAGTSDLPGLLDSNRSLSAALDAKGIEHEFAEVEEGHALTGPGLFERWIPFLSNALSGERASTAVEAASWGAVKRSAGWTQRQE